MNNDIEAFRFMAIRPPDSSNVDTSIETVPLASDEQISQSSDTEAAEIESQKIALWLDDKLENVDSNDEQRLDSILAERNLKKQEAVSAVVKFGKSAKTIQTLSKHALSDSVRNRIRDILNVPPLVLDLPTPSIPDEVLQKLLNKRKAFFGPVGVGDLMIVEKILAGYEFGEIAHIENVLGFESRTRDHKVRTELDVFTETIEETQKFSEVDLQSTERFELKNSIKEEIESQQKKDISHRVNTQYPPYVETEAEFNYSKENSKQRSTGVSETLCMRHCPCGFGGSFVEPLWV